MDPSQQRLASQFPYLLSARCQRLPEGKSPLLKEHGGRRSGRERNLLRKSTKATAEGAVGFRT
jgi:hypothetical protein